MTVMMMMMMIMMIMMIMMMMIMMLIMMLTGAGAAAVHDSVPRRGGHSPGVPGGAGAHGQGQGEAGPRQEARQAPAGQQVQEDE